MLKKLERRTATSTYPRGIFSSAVLRPIRSVVEFSARSVLFLSHKPESLENLKRLRNSKSGKYALVIANGPSAERIRPERINELQILGQLEVFVMNGFYKSGLNEKITPDNYVLSDPDHAPYSPNLFEGLWSFISDGSVKVFCPRTWNIDSEIIAPDRVAHFEDRPLEIWSKNTNPTRPRGYPSMTAFKALAIANYMGFEKIFVIGLDNSMFLTLEVDVNNRILQGPNHAGASGGSSSYLLDDFFPGGISDYFYGLAHDSYQLKKLFKKYPITNLDGQSFTDAFRKGDPLRIAG
jgi:hypothetical protein